MSATIRVTVDGEPVTREVALDQVREYLRAKGWSREERSGAPECFVMSTPGHLFVIYPEVTTFARMLDRIARHEGRHPAAVLREIAAVGAPAPPGAEPFSADDIADWERA